MRTNPIRDQGITEANIRSEPNVSTDGSKAIARSVEAAVSVSTDGSTCTAGARIVAGQDPNVSTDGSPISARIVAAAASASMGGGLFVARSAMRNRMVVVLCLMRKMVCKAKWASDSSCAEPNQAADCPLLTDTDFL